MYSTVSESDVKTTFYSPFSSWLITSSFSLIPIVFHHFLILIALDNVDLRFSLMLIRKANSVEEKTT
jgi:hypothetical protein